MQPILVRAKGKKYEIVCGERRFRASQMVQTQDKKRDNIPAIIRELSDQEVREMQLIENFQREDVHPMEEALAIKYAVETGQYTIEDLKLKVGKSMTYMKQRMKLNDLTENWQKLFFNGNLTITAALSIAQFSNDIQEKILEERFDFEELLATPSEKVEVDVWWFKMYKGQLSSASFDLADETLNPKMGACNKCHFNTANAGLFPDESSAAKCNNISCFNTKTETNFKLRLEEAKQDPSVVFVSSNYHTADNIKLVADLVSLGHEVFNRNSYNQLEAPEIIDHTNGNETFEEFKQEWMDDNDGDINGAEEAWLDATNDFHKEKADYEKQVASGKYKKAFVVDGTGYGKYIYITLNKKKSIETPSSGKKVDVKDESVTVGDIDSEITRISEKEKRSKQIDENKIWDDLKKHFSPVQNVPLKTGELKQIEITAIAKTIYEKIDWRYHDEFVSLFKLGTRRHEADFSKVTDTMLRQMLRFFMLNLLPPATLFNGFDENAKLCLEVAKEYFPSVLDDVKETYKENIEKRIARVDARINELNSLKKELLKKSPAKEKLVKKSATKKK